MECLSQTAGIPHHAGSGAQQVRQKHPEKADIGSDQDVFKGSPKSVVVLTDMTPWPCACPRNEHDIQGCHYSNLESSQGPGSLQNRIDTLGHCFES